MRWVHSRLLHSTTATLNKPRNRKNLKWASILQEPCVKLLSMESKTLSKESGIETKKASKQIISTIQTLKAEIWSRYSLRDIYKKQIFLQPDADEGKGLQATIKGLERQLDNLAMQRKDTADLDIYTPQLGLAVLEWVLYYNCLTLDVGSLHKNLQQYFTLRKKDVMLMDMLSTRTILNLFRTLKECGEYSWVLDIWRRLNSLGWQPHLSSSTSPSTSSPTPTSTEKRELVCVLLELLQDIVLVHGVGDDADWESKMLLERFQLNLDGMDATVTREFAALVAQRYQEVPNESVSGSVKRWLLAKKYLPFSNT